MARNEPTIPFEQILPAAKRFRRHHSASAVFFRTPKRQGFLLWKYPDNARRPIILADEEKRLVVFDRSQVDQLRLRNEECAYDFGRAEKLAARPSWSYAAKGELYEACDMGTDILRAAGATEIVVSNSMLDMLLGATANPLTEAARDCWGEKRFLRLLAVSAERKAEVRAFLRYAREQLDEGRLLVRAV